jgi:hypothetical protein
MNPRRISSTPAPASPAVACSLAGEGKSARESSVHQHAVRWWQRWRHSYRAALEMDTVELVARLTLLVLLFNPVSDGVMRSLGLLLAGLGTVFPSLARRPSLWLGLALLTGWWVLADWPLADNHAYLLCYWCLAMCSALVVQDHQAALALNGRWLIGLAFACATLWKAALSPDYLDGTFFRVMLMVDERFEEVVLRVSGLSQEQLAANRYFLEEDRIPAGFRPDTPTLVEPLGFTRFARGATWWTVLLEATVALSFLWPGRGWIARQRHAALLLFCATTFAIAPVVGFGWLLLVMGITQCEPGRTVVRIVYLGVFFVLLFYQALS